MKVRLAATLLLLSATCHAATLSGEVVGVADGDTISLQTADKVQRRIRLDGIDAPERTQPYSQTAKRSLSAMVYRQQVTAECSRRDPYGRDVCKVLGNGRDVGLAQIQRGLAWHFKRHTGAQSPDDRAAYAQAEEQAQAARRGLWQDSSPVPPWEFRAANRTARATAQ